MIPSRPLPLVGILAETFSIYGKTIVRYALLFLILIVPGVIFLTIGSTNATNDIVTSAQHDIGLNDSTLTALRNDARTWIDVQDPMFAAEWPMGDTAHYPHASTLQFGNYLESHTSYFESSASLFFIGIVLFMVGGFALVSVIIDLASRVFEEHPQALGPPLRDAFARNVWKMLFLYIVYSVLSWIVDEILLALPGAVGGIFTSFRIVIEMYLLIRLSLTFPALVSEELRPFQAVARSWELTRGAGWRIFGGAFAFGVLYFFAVVLLSMVISIVAGSPFLWLNDFFTLTHITVGWFLQGISGLIQSLALLWSIVLLLLFSLVPIFATVFYYDLRTRHDGPLVYLED